MELWGGNGTLLVLILLGFLQGTHLTGTASVSAIDVSASSYFSRPGEARDEYHPRYGMDADTMTCFRSGYHSVPWWQATLDVLYDVDYVDFYGRFDGGLRIVGNNTLCKANIEAAPSSGGHGYHLYRVRCDVRIGAVHSVKVMSDNQSGAGQLTVCEISVH